jgi:queuine tRNA-ribosyltransferase
MLGPILLSLHNITFYQRLMNEIRRRIDDQSFAGWAEEQIRFWRAFESSEPDTENENGK